MLIHGVEVLGIDLDRQSRCAHYRSLLDIVSIRFPCCDRYYACYECHAAVADHKSWIWPTNRFDEPVVLCGGCGTILSINEYLGCGSVCPKCSALFNPGCKRHWSLYFEQDSPMEFDLQPVLAGNLLELRPLKPDEFEELFAVASDPLIWEQHPSWDRYKEEVFKNYFREAIDSKGAFAIIDRSNRMIIGSTRYGRLNTNTSEIEIGWTFLARNYWGGTFNLEMKTLMLDHAFQFVDNVTFIIGENNLRSRKAVEKIGGMLVGKGADAGGNPSVIYRIAKADWESRTV